MTSGDSGHIFIFHYDEDWRSSSVWSGKILVAGERNEEKDYPDSSKYTPSGEETTFIRRRSALLNSSISRQPNLPTHVWPDRDRQIRTSTLRYVVESLTLAAPHPEGTNQLQEMSDICSVIWVLKCDREPFLDTANSILENWQKKRREASEAEAKWLTIITFVLGQDEDLKTHLESLVWHSSAELQCPIEDLQEWVNKRRKKNLGRIYSFFYDQITRLCLLKPNSALVKRIYSNLTDRADQSGIGVDFRLLWSEHRDNGGGLLNISPRKFTDDVLSILKEDVVGSRVQTEDGAAGSTLSEVSRHASSHRSGIRGGRGGDFKEFFWSLVKPPQEEDEGVSAIRSFVKTAEDKMENEWKELKQDKIRKLIVQRNAEQAKWASGFLVPGSMNGNIIRSNNL